MKQLKTFLFILSIALISSCSPKEESPDLVTEPTNNGGGGGGTGGGGGGTGGGGGGGTGGPVANEVMIANYFSPSGGPGGNHTSTSFEAFDTLNGTFIIQGIGAKTYLSISFKSNYTTGQNSLSGLNNFFISDMDSFPSNPPKFYYSFNSGAQNSVSVSQIDTVAHTIKGTFTFEATSSAGSLSITAGNFHVNYDKR